MRPRFPVLTAAIFVAAALLLSTACSRADRLASAHEPPALTEARVTFLAVGDMMISRGVARAIRRAGDPLAPFQKMESILLSTDFNFGNLESPISGRNHVIGKGLTFNTHEGDVVGLREYNFRVLNLANNHALDMGINGLRHTMDVLEGRDVTYLGVGDDLGEAWQPKTLVVNGMKIGFVGASYSSFNDGGVARNSQVARMEETVRLQESIERLRADGADFVVATMHGGVEYTRRPDKTQVAFAHAAIDFGADIVIGSHPHWVQTIETYQGKYIFYSLGNFIFDQEWSRDTKEGLAIKVTLNCYQESPAADCSQSSPRTVEQIELIPIVIENYSTPRPAEALEAEAILKKIGSPPRVIEPEKERLLASE